MGSIFLKAYEEIVSEIYRVWMANSPTALINGRPHTKTMIMSNMLIHY